MSITDTRQLAYKPVPTAIMADINQFIRSKERLCEMLNELVHQKPADSKTAACIQSIEHSIKVLDEKIAEYLGLDEFQAPDPNIFFGLA